MDAAPPTFLLGINAEAVDGATSVAVDVAADVVAAVLSVVIAVDDGASAVGVLVVDLVAITVSGLVTGLGLLSGLVPLLVEDAVRAKAGMFISARTSLAASPKYVSGENPARCTEIPRSSRLITTLEKVESPVRGGGTRASRCFSCCSFFFKAST